MLGTCHCSRCRKLGSSAIIFIRREHLNWIQGKDQVALYQPEAPYKYGRCFCKNCGTSLGEILSEEDSFPIAANALDTENYPPEPVPRICRGKAVLARDRRRCQTVRRPSGVLGRMRKGGAGGRT